MKTLLHIYDTRTGDVKIVDPVKARLNRLRRKIKSWSDALLSYAQKSLIMVTLTYRKSEDWEPRQVTEFIRKVKRQLGDSLIAYAWVCEVQKRGAPHYHIYFVVTPGTRLPKPDTSGLWSYGMSNIQRGRSIYYLLAYTSKAKQKEFSRLPKGARAFSAVILKPLKDKSFYCFRMSHLPQWLREKIDIENVMYYDNLPKRLKTSLGYLWHFVNLYLKSPYKVGVEKIREVKI